MALPIDEIVVDSKVEDERLELGLQLQAGVVGIAKVGLVHASRVDRLTIHDAVPSSCRRRKLGVEV